MANLKPYKWTLKIELEVDPLWGADGFEARTGEIEDAIRSKVLTDAYEDEFRVTATVVRAPSPERIAKEQGLQVDRQPVEHPGV